MNKNFLTEAQRSQRTQNFRSMSFL